MTDGLSFAEIDGQHVELLPARTVLSLFGADCYSCGYDGGDGGDGQGGIGLNVLNINVLGSQGNFAGNGVGGDGG